jgi:hypothetical protein
MANKLEVFEDVDLPAGSVVVAVAQTDTADLGLMVARKNTDRPFLGPHGWQAGEHVFPPSAVRSTAGNSEMVFGSEVTRHIGVDMNVTLSVPALGISERHFWPSITAAPGKQGVNIHAIRKPDPLMAVKPQVLMTEKPPETAGETNPILPETPSAADPRFPKPKPEEMSSGFWTRRNWWIAATLLVLLIAGAVLVYLYALPGDRSQQQAEPAAVTNDFASRYRTLFGQTGQGEALLSLGREALAANATEVGFNAVTLSADRGFAPAKLLLGQWYDPLTEPRGPARPNPNNAALYYAEASTGGQADGAAALQRLCATAKASPPPAWAEAFDTGTHCP